MSDELTKDADAAAVDVLNMTGVVPTSRRLVIAAILVIREAERQYGPERMNALKEQALAIDALMDAVMEGAEPEEPGNAVH